MTRVGQLCAAVSVAGLLLAPALAAEAPRKKPAPVSLSFNPVSTFTPASADARLAAVLGKRSSSLTDLQFTPAPAKGRPSQVRVAIRARANTPLKGAAAQAAAGGAAAPVTLAPASYNLGVAVGWRRFAVSGNVSSTKGDPALGERESAALGVSYSLNKNLTAKASVGAERGDPRKSAAIRGTDNVSVDLGSTLALSKRVALTGGVRYRIDSDRLSTLNDHRRDSQAVYIGTAFKF
ncbi:MAG TPA: porin [Sphingomicrobium sp.]